MDNTKSVHLNEMEMKVLLRYYGSEIQVKGEYAADFNIERLRYLNKRLKDFNEPTNEAKTSW